ncbi:MAG: sulfotransferase [Candidatus Thiodiazotropha sp. (ex Ustalcina ferruginea)]|nr:sulfotransferase [Candidatus Thiodiazotropha sp. (ex Ustalcina ferruginea)]
MIAQLDKEYLQYGKGFAFRRLASYLLFEGRPHTTRGQWVNPFINGFLRLLATLPGEVRADRPIYITGLGRSGTTILGKILSLHEDVGFLNEPKMMWAIADTKTDICGDYYPSAGRFMLEAADAHSKIKRTVNRVLARYARLVGVKRALDKYPEFIFRVDYLTQVFPDAKIVFIARNGIDAVASVARWSQTKGVQVGAHTDDWWGRGDVKWKYLCEQIIRTNPEYSDVAPLCLEEFDHINCAAMEWIVTMRQGLLEMEKRPGLIYRINYEDLVKHPVDQLVRLLQACELSISDSLLAYSKKVLYELPQKEKPVLHRPIAAMFDETMQRMGY